MMSVCVAARPPATHARPPLTPARHSRPPLTHSLTHHSLTTHSPEICFSQLYSDEHYEI